MLRVYLYRKSDGKQPDYAWQHAMGQNILAWVREQPENRGLSFHNISHSGPLVAVAVSDVQVGVDTEVRRAVSRRLMCRALSEKEQQRLFCQTDPQMGFLRFWTLKEAYGKARRTGLAYPLKQVEFMMDESAKNGQWMRVPCSAADVTCFCFSDECCALSVCACAMDAPEPVIYMLQNTFFV